MLQDGGEDWAGGRQGQDDIDEKNGKLKGDEAVPFHPKQRRPWSQWIIAWLGRELLALPIWTWAFYGGMTVEWRGEHFTTGANLRVREVARRGGKKRE